MKDSNYHRLVQTSITAFIHKDNKYLFLKRNAGKRIDPGRLNGVGGRLEPGENYLECCIREVAEETGFIVSPKNIELSGVVKLEGGYTENWVVCFYKVEVDSFDIPKGAKTEDGELMWIDKDKVLTSKYSLVDDINYCFKDIVDGQRIFFLTAMLNSNQSIEKKSISYLKK